jgi:hypothetical protein
MILSKFSVFSIVSSILTLMAVLPDSSVFEAWLESGQEEVPPYLSFICDGRRAGFVRRLSIHNIDDMMAAGSIIHWDTDHRPQPVLAFLDVLRTELRALSIFRSLSVLAYSRQRTMDAFLSDFSPIGGDNPSLLCDPNRHMARELSLLQHPEISSVELLFPTFTHTYAR